MHEGREQGAELGAETVYVREYEGEHQERRAYTPADVVNLEARGWRLRDSGAQSTGGQGASPVQSTPAPKAVVPSGSTSAPASPKPAAPAAGESA